MNYDKIKEYSQMKMKIPIIIKSITPMMSNSNKLTKLIIQMSLMLNLYRSNKNNDFFLYLFFIILYNKYIYFKWGFFNFQMIKNLNSLICNK